MPMLLQRVLLRTDPQSLRASAALASILALAATGAGAGEKIEGVVAEVSRKEILLDSSRVRIPDGGRVVGDARKIGEVKVGQWAEASGEWNDEGLFKAERLEVRDDAPGHSFAEKLQSRSGDESRKLAQSGKIAEDPEVTAYVQRVGIGLVPAYARDQFEFSFSVIEDPSLNAFALPNGSIYVHTGLLARMDNEAQLAVVLGHEIGHVTQLHGQRNYKRMVSFMVPAQIGAILLGIQVQRRTDNPLLGFMTSLGLNLGLSAAVNGYGRTLEDQADRVGLRYAVETGYDYRESPKIWDTFNDVYGEEGKFENFFYSNHSTNEVRKENLKSEIALHYRRAGIPPEPAPDALAVNRDSYQATMIGLVRDNAVSDFELERYRLAGLGFEKVLARRPDDPVAHHYQGRIVLATSEGPDARRRARSLYEQALAVDPEYAAAHRDLGLLLADMSQAAEAREHLRKYLSLAPADAEDRKAVEKRLAALG